MTRQALDSHVHPLDAAPAGGADGGTAIGGTVASPRQRSGALAILAGAVLGGSGIALSMVSVAGWGKAGVALAVGGAVIAMGGFLGRQASRREARPPEPAPKSEPQPEPQPCVRQAWDRIAALSRLDGLPRMQGEILALLERKPDHSGALYLRGCHLAQSGDSHAIGFLERAANDPTLTTQALGTLAEYHRHHGDPGEPERLRRRCEQHASELRFALIERNQVQVEDRFFPHSLPDATLRSLERILEARGAVRRAWLVSKHVRYFPHWRHYVLLLELRSAAFSAPGTRQREQIAANILAEWEIDGFVLAVQNLEEQWKILRTIRRAVPDCEVFRRK